jgi:hypothetical protein
MPVKNVTATNTRLPDDLHSELARAAREACRSLNGEIVWRLRESLKDERGYGAGCDVAAA